MALLAALHRGDEGAGDFLRDNLLVASQEMMAEEVSALIVARVPPEKLGTHEPGQQQR